MNIDTIRGEIRERVEEVTEPFGIEYEMEKVFDGIPAFFVEENSSLLQTAEKLTGHDGISVAFGTEAPFLRNLGMDTVIMGPGNIDQAHQPDEYMSMDMINPSIEILNRLISHYCLT